MRDPYLYEDVPVYKKYAWDKNSRVIRRSGGYVRTALVAYNAYFADGSDFRKKEYLYKIVYDAFKE